MVFKFSYTDIVLCKKGQGVENPKITELFQQQLKNVDIRLKRRMSANKVPAE